MHKSVLTFFLFGVKRKVAVKIEMIIRITAEQRVAIQFAREPLWLQRTHAACGAGQENCCDFLTNLPVSNRA